MSLPLDDRNITDELDVDGSQWEPCDQCIWGHGKMAVDEQIFCKICYTARLKRQHQPY